MKTNNEIQSEAADNPSFKRFCQTMCRKLVGQIQNAKEVFFNEFRPEFGAEEKVLRLALNEAEALAWETGYPNLVFPELAMEKAQSAAEWERRQQAMKVNHGSGSRAPSRAVFA